VVVYNVHASTDIEILSIWGRDFENVRGIEPYYLAIPDRHLLLFVTGDESGRGQTVVHLANTETHKIADFPANGSYIGRDFGTVAAVLSKTYTVTIAITNSSDIVNRLRKHSDPVSAFVWEALSKSQRSRLMRDDTSPYFSWANAMVVEGLTKRIRGPCIYEAERFKGIVLRPETTDLMTQNPKGPALVHLNRLLFEDAYPQELRRIDTNRFARVLTLDGDKLVVGSAEERLHYKYFIDLSVPRFEREEEDFIDPVTGNVTHHVYENGKRGPL